VVLDDLRDAADLDELWPTGPAGRVLITTPDPATVSGEDRVLALPIRVFSTREALSYLMGRLTADPDQRIGAIDLVGDLGCEPLALAQASAVIASSGLSCRDYRDHFAQRQARLAGIAEGVPSAATVTWTLSVEHAERLAPRGGAQYLLALAALLDGHGIPGAAFTTSAVCEYLGEGGSGPAVDPNVAWGALLSLERSGLLSIDSATTPPTVRLTPTVQAAIRAATTRAVSDRAARAAADALLEVWPADEPQAWIAADLRSCAAGLQHATGDTLWAGGSAHPLLVRTGRSMDSARLTGPAVACWRELAATSDRIAGPGSSDTLMAGSRLAGALLARQLLGDTYLADGRVKDAISQLKRVLADREEVLGRDHLDTIVARGSLASAYHSAGKMASALQLYEQACEGYARVLGADDPETLRSRGDQADAYYKAGRLTDATRLLRDTLERCDRVLPPEDPLTRTVRESLTNITGALPEIP
jgi:tetratricopeptide (TPR) repeat protein